MKKLLLPLLLVLPAFGFAQSADTVANPLKPFEFLIGGAWQTNTTYQTFEWGLGQKTVESKLYFIQGDSLALKGEITWFWHPGQEKIKGYGTGVDMGVDLFDYETKFESNGLMVNHFNTYGERGLVAPQMEVLEFIEDDQYEWTYYNYVNDEPVPAYSITFTRGTDDRTPG